MKTEETSPNVSNDTLYKQNVFPSGTSIRSPRMNLLGSVLIVISDWLSAFPPAALALAHSGGVIRLFISVA